MNPLSYEEAQKVHRRLLGDPAVYRLVRQFATQYLLKDWPEEEGLGTSDVSIHVTEMLRVYEIPLVGPVVAAYVDCGFNVPESDQHGPVLI